jgi:Zn-dependent peptidase ImmA (M78 family)/DNA-binding XRE family transcriptional regulator
MTKIALARRAGLSTRSLYDIETGQAAPTIETLTAIAEVLHFPLAFFYLADVEEPSLESASFRALRSMTATQRDGALAAGGLAFELNRWIEHRFDLPKTNLPNLRDYEPEAAADALRVHWHIGQRPIGNMIHFLESVGVRVFSIAEDRRVDAFSLWHQDVPFVFLNTVKTAEHSRMDAAHELGHLVLHRHGVPWGRNIEKEAQTFGASFLMPRGSVFAAPKIQVPTLNQLVQLKKRWLVSGLALAHRLHALGLLSDWNYRNLCIQLSEFGKTREPEGIPRETSQVMAKVFGPLGAAKDAAAKELGLYQSDVEALVFGLRAEPQIVQPTRSHRRVGESHGLRLVRER